MMNVVLVVCHPSPDSFNHALAKTLGSTWSSLGSNIKFHDLHAEGFDPILSADEARGEPAPDPTVRKHIDEIRECDLLGIVHPNYWGAPPALMKGWIDRVFAPEAAYTFAKGVDQGDEPIGLLRAASALVLNTGNTPMDRENDHFGDPLDQIWRACILNYCGIKHVQRKLFGVVNHLVSVPVTVRDTPLSTGVVIVYTLMFITLNVLIDLFYFAVDPRVRAAGGVKS